MPNCKSFLVIEADRKRVSQCAHFQQHGNARCQVLFLSRQDAKESHAILTKTLREHAPSYATVKNWVAQFKHANFSTCVAPRPGRPKTVTVPEITEQFTS